MNIFAEWWPKKRNHALVDRELYWKKLWIEAVCHSKLTKVNWFLPFFLPQDCCYRQNEGCSWLFWAVAMYMYGRAGTHRVVEVFRNAPIMTFIWEFYEIHKGEPQWMSIFRCQEIVYVLDFTICFLIRPIWPSCFIIRPIMLLSQIVEMSHKTFSRITKETFYPKKVIK